MMSIKGFWARPAVIAPVVATTMLIIIIFLAPILSESKPIGIERMAETKLAAEEAKLTTELAEEASVSEELPTEVPTMPEPALVPTEVTLGEVTEPLPVVDSTAISQEVSFVKPTTEEKTRLRFAEEILVASPSKPGTKPKKKGTRRKESEKDDIRITKLRRAKEFIDDEEY